MMKQAAIYILTNKNRTVFYTGVTNNLAKRLQQHQEGIGSAFTRKYNCNILVYFETFPDIEQAIQREKYIKNRSREWKLNLIKSLNPELKDMNDW